MKVSLRQGSLTVTELNKQLKEQYTRLKKQNKWTDHEMACIVLVLKPKEHQGKYLRADAPSVKKLGIKVWTAGKEKRTKVNAQRIGPVK